MAVELGSELLCCNHTLHFFFLPPEVPELRQVRRAPLRRAEFQQFGYTDSCPGCANVRAGRKQAVEHSEQCRSRMDAILVTTTEGRMRLQRARERFAEFAEEPGVMESPRKRHPPEGSPLRHQHEQRWSRVSTREGGSTGNGSPLLANVPLAKRSLEQETHMADASVQQGERMRWRSNQQCLNQRTAAVRAQPTPK